jgi:hypothetical protein
MSALTGSWPKEAAASIEIEAWPLRDQPAVAWLTISLLVLAGALVWWVTRSWLLAFLATSLAAISTWQVFVPQRFEFSTNGVIQHVWRRKRRIAWTAIGRCEPRAGGIFLLPAGADAPIDAIHGLFIPLGSRRHEVLTFIQKQLMRLSTSPAGDSAKSGGSNPERPA